MFASRKNKKRLTRSLAHSPTRSHHPAGFSLLEVVLAMAIFFGSAAVLSQLLLIAARTARWGEGMTEATLRCESKMAELTSGIVPLARREEVPFLDNPDWEYSVEIMPTPIPSLVRVTLTVVHRTGEKQDVEAGLARLFATDESIGSPSPLTGEGRGGGDGRVMDASLLNPPPSRGWGPGSSEPSARGLNRPTPDAAPLTVEEMLGLTEEAP